MSFTKRVYVLAELYGAGVYAMNSIGVDPISAKQQLIECPVCCQDVGYHHVRGKLPGIYRCGDSLAAGRHVQRRSVRVRGGHYALPWNSNSIPMT